MRCNSPEWRARCSRPPLNCQSHFAPALCATACGKRAAHLLKPLKAVTIRLVNPRSLRLTRLHLRTRRRTLSLSFSLSDGFPTVCKRPRRPCRSHQRVITGGPFEGMQNRFRYCLPTAKGWRIILLVAVDSHARLSCIGDWASVCRNLQAAALIRLPAFGADIPMSLSAIPRGCRWRPRRPHLPFEKVAHRPVKLRLRFPYREIARGSSPNRALRVRLSFMFDLYLFGAIIT